MRTVPVDVKKAEAAALKALYDAQQPRPAHGKFGQQHGIGTTPGMVWQYLAGHRPLNLQAATQFAIGLGVPISAFSQRLALQAAAANSTRLGYDEAKKATSVVAREPMPADFGWPFTGIDLVRIRAMSPTQRRQLEVSWLRAAQRLGFDLATASPQADVTKPTPSQDESLANLKRILNETRKSPALPAHVVKVKRRRAPSTTTKKGNQ